MIVEIRRIPRYVFLSPTHYIEKPIEYRHELYETQIVDSRKKSKWTKEEDRLLLSAIEKTGGTKWSKISEYVPGRTGKQCRERWLVTLSPEIVKGEWTYEEDLALLKLQHEHGNKWARFGSCFPGRSTTSIKNRWTWLTRRGIPLIYDRNYDLLKNKTCQEKQKDVFMNEMDRLHSCFSEDQWRQLLEFPRE